jgi:hypothetical protein
MWTWAAVAIATVVLAAAYWYYSRPAADPATTATTPAATAAPTAKTLSNFNYAGCDGSYTYDPRVGAYVGGTAESPRTLQINGSQLSCITQAGDSMGDRTIVSGTPGNGEVNFD